MLGLLRNYNGTITVNGFECKKVKRSFYANIGVMMEYPSIYTKLTGVENINFFSSLH